MQNHSQFNTHLQKKPKRSKKERIAVLMTLNVLIVLSLAVLLSVYGRVFYQEVRYAVASVFDEDIKNSKKYYDGLPRNISAGQDIQYTPIVTIPKPKDPNFSVIIPKIDVNQKVITNVNINDAKEVERALGQGIGWARGTAEPGNDGNSLLFSHSTQNAWDIFRYNSVFTLLRKVEVNDFFTVVYDGRQLDFVVFEKKIVPASDRSYVTSVAEGKVVTLQTCDPPGSDKNRLLIRGRLVAMELK
jgi:LPXTG-site transpeptidase (sortase) family protein